ncbi:hypothetical protein [Streptomyces cadmiisoli]|uniref:hypothetical protein n=1 Tax=Streptomyces cadmiisoli TaxID=2184053 RepID=UPI00364E4D82
MYRAVAGVSPADQFRRDIGCASPATEEPAVYDRDGAAQCALTGPAPNRALVHTHDVGDDATGPYTIAFHRTDAANDYPVLPAGSFTADDGKATPRTGDGVFSRCLNIPADAHTKAEVLHLVNTSGGVAAKFSVLEEALAVRRVG